MVSERRPSWDSETTYRETYTDRDGDKLCIERFENGALFLGTEDDNHVAFLDIEEVDQFLDMVNEALGMPYRVFRVDEKTKVTREGSMLFDQKGNCLGTVAVGDTSWPDRTVELRKIALDAAVRALEDAEAVQKFVAAEAEHRTTKLVSEFNLPKDVMEFEDIGPGIQKMINRILELEGEVKA